MERNTQPAAGKGLLAEQWGSWWAQRGGCYKEACVQLG